jgi:hypothetical protein
MLLLLFFFFTYRYLVNFGNSRAHLAIFMSLCKPTYQNLSIVTIKRIDTKKRINELSLIDCKWNFSGTHLFIYPYTN